MAPCEGCYSDNLSAMLQICDVLKSGLRELMYVDYCMQNSHKKYVSIIYYNVRTAPIDVISVLGVQLNRNILPARQRSPWTCHLR